MEGGVDLEQHLSVVRACLVQPEDRRGTRGPSTGDGQRHPVGDRGVLGAAHAPDVALLDIMADDSVAGLVDDVHTAGA